MSGVQIPLAPDLRLSIIESLFYLTIKTMNTFFDDLITGLNEAIAIESGKFKDCKKNIEVVQDNLDEELPLNE